MDAFPFGMLAPALMVGLLAVAAIFFATNVTAPRE